jgi:hypothetical protein
MGNIASFVNYNIKVCIGRRTKIHRAIELSSHEPIDLSHLMVVRVSVVLEWYEYGLEAMYSSRLAEPRLNRVHV